MNELSPVQTPPELSDESRFEGFKRHKLFWRLIAGFIVLFLIGINGYLYYSRIQLREGIESLAAQDALNRQIIEQTRLREVDSFSNWKTYRNEEYGFEFKYPEKASIYDYNGEGYLKDTVGVGVHMGWADVTFEILADYDWTEFIKREKDYTPDKFTEERIIIDNQIGTKFIHHITNGCTVSYIGIRNSQNRKYFFHNLITCPTHQAGFDEQENQILSTFKFIK
jgi:hypothetical protein